MLARLAAKRRIPYFPIMNESIDEQRDPPKRIEIIANARAGAVLQAGQEAFRTQLAAAFGPDASIRLVPPERLSEQLREAAAARPDLIVVAGGDGTINRLLPVLSDLDARLAVLPLGTFNLLARDLGLGAGIKEDAQRIVGGRPVEIDIATVNGRPFHSNVGLGFYGRMALERENARRRFPFSKAVSASFALLKSLAMSRPILVEIEVEGSKSWLVADAVLVTNNCFHGTPWTRPSLQDGMLEVQVLRTGSAGSRLRTAWRVARGTWRSLPSLEIFTTQSFSLRRRFKSSSKVAIDGELEKMRGTLHFAIKPKALRLRAPL
jgi:diacylglycerol kinase family enzyme